MTAFRTLFITADSPFPASSGAPLRNWQNVTLAAEMGPVAVVSIGHGDPEVDRLPNVACWEHVKVDRTAPIAPRGYPMLGGAPLDAILAGIEDVRTRFAPTIVMFENLWLERLPPRLRAGGERIVFDSHNVYAAVAEELDLGVDAVRRLERTAVEAADELWVCSTDDAQRMRSEYALERPIHVVPNGIDADAYAGVRAGRPRRRTTPTLIFVGAYWYEPNRIAAESLIAEILPAVRARLGPDVRLLLIGAAPSAAMLAAAERDGKIVVTGRVPDVRPYLGLADVSVVPLRQGGGTRLKILESFAAARPVVATAKAAEGLDARDGEHLLVRESVDEIVDAICTLWADPVRATELGRSGYELVNATYSWQALRGTVRTALQAALPPSVEAALGARDRAV
jgi:glycosyltransferase involved in cell wall biosynthesis